MALGSVGHVAQVVENDSKHTARMKDLASTLHTVNVLVLNSILWKS